ncbi:MAG: hypothetical protein V1746_07705 [bacterium]
MSDQPKKSRKPSLPEECRTVCELYLEFLRNEKKGKKSPPPSLPDDCRDVCEEFAQTVLDEEDNIVPAGQTEGAEVKPSLKGVDVTGLFTAFEEESPEGPSR